MTTIIIEIKDWVLWLIAGFLIIEAISSILSAYQRYLQRKLNKHELEANQLNQ